MNVSKVMGDLVFAPYRIGRLQKNKKVNTLFFIIQIPYLLIPGSFFIFGTILYLLFVHAGTMMVNFLDLLINSKKYKYTEDGEYSEAYLNLESSVFDPL